MARVEIPLIGPHYTNREKPLSAQVTKNLFPQVDPEARNPVSLHNVAGTKTFGTLEGVDRGMHDFNNLMYAVNGSSLYSIDADGINTNLGTISGSDRCVLANDSIQLIIVTGSTPYRYTVSGGLEAITDPDLVNPTSVAYLNSQFIFDQNAGVFGEFVTSSIEAGLAIDALDFAQAESHPDDIIRVMAFGPLVYFFGSHTVEPWQNTGVGNPPFAVIRAGVKPYGLAGTHGVVATSEYMYFLDAKRIPRRSSGLDYVNIGNPALGVEFAKYSKIDDVVAFEFTQDHQQFFALTFPTANRTWCFHETSGTWFQLSHGINNDRHRATSMLNIYGLNYCADHTNGLIYEYSLDVYSDNGDPIIKQRDTATIHGGMLGVPGKKLFFDMVEFIIVGGQTEVAGTGLGPQPIVADTGLCGTSADIDQGGLLGATPLPYVGYTVGDSAGDVESMVDSKVVSFTAAFTRNAAPDSGLEVGLIDIYNTTNSRSGFRLLMEGNGYIKAEGKNIAGTTILDLQLTNNGSSFADGTIYMIAGVIDLSDTSRREVYINGVNVGESTWATWNTYTDDLMNLNNDVDAMYYMFGGLRSTTLEWGAVGSGYNGTGETGYDDCAGYISFDNACTLISSSVWDTDGWVRDPQAWNGWYMDQPYVFYGPSFWKNSGRTAPATYGADGLEAAFGTGTTDYYISNSNATGQDNSTVLNAGVGSTVEATGGDSLPSAPDADPQTEIVAPFWENTGNWIDLAKLTQTTFESMFGVPIETSDFNSVFAVNKAALVNTGDAGNRLQIQDSADAGNAAMYVVDSSGNVIDSMIYAGVANGDSVLVPTGSNYYIVVTSDSGNAKIRKWDTTQVSTAGSTAWESWFGLEFGLHPFYYTEKVIDQSGISLAFTVPVTTTAQRVVFGVIMGSNVSGTATGSVNQTVGDYTSAPTYTWGVGGGIDAGINDPGRDIDLIPGETYFFNVKNDTPTSSNNTILIQVTIQDV